MSGFESYIIDNEINKRNLELLIKEFQKEVFIPFVGAGLSTPLGEPDWLDLFKKLKNKYNLKINIKKDRDSQIDFPKLFSRIYNELPQKNNFYKDVFEILEPTKCTYTSVHVSLVNLFDSYLTTNYDSPIEGAYYVKKNKNLTKYYLFCPQPDNNFEKCIVYLHGHKDINFAIIKDEDYRYFYPSVSSTSGTPILEDFLVYILKKKKVIFVGSSFSDRYLTSFLKLVSKEMNKHFLLIDAGVEIYQRYIKIVEEYRRKGKPEEAQKQENKIYDYFENEFNILPIVYKHELYVFLQYLFERLSMSEELTLEERPISGVPEL